MTTPDFTKGAQVSEGKKSPRTLSDVAETLNLNRDASGTVVVDNRTVEKITGEVLDPGRYVHLPSPELWSLAEKYDRLGIKLDRLRKVARNEHTYEGIERMSRNIGEQKKRDAARSKLFVQGVVVCWDEPIYFIFEKGKRGEPMEGYPCAKNHHRLY